MHGTNHNSVTFTESPTESIPDNNHLIGFEQTLSNDRSLPLGVILHLYDENTSNVITLEVGSVIGTEREDIQWLGGSFHAMKWRADDLLRKVQVGFNSCHCLFGIDTLTTPIQLGEESTVSFTSVSFIGDGIFHTSADSCLTPTLLVVGGNDLISFDNYLEGTIYSVDPDLVGVDQTITVTSLPGTATATIPDDEADITFAFSPSCKYSPITSSQSYPDFSVPIDGSFEFDLNADAYTHEYKSAWDAVGYPDGCTISFNIEGETDLATITGTTVTVDAPDDSSYGVHNF